MMRYKVVYSTKFKKDRKQKLDELIRVAVKKGDVTIEEQTIKGIETKEFDL